jgi:DNA anti-recombination protein RmuC
MATEALDEMFFQRTITRIDNNIVQFVSDEELTQLGQFYAATHIGKVSIDVVSQVVIPTVELTTIDTLEFRVVSTSIDMGENTNDMIASIIQSEDQLQNSLSEQLEQLQLAVAQEQERLDELYREGQQQLEVELESERERIINEIAVEREQLNERIVELEDEIRIKDQELQQRIAQLQQFESSYEETLAEIDRIEQEIANVRSRIRGTTQLLVDNLYNGMTARDIDRIFSLNLFSYDFQSHPNDIGIALGDPYFPRGTRLIEEAV